MMRVLGAILAGGRSSRFGSDKALALLDGVQLIDHVAERLAPQVAALVVCGRNHRDLIALPDRPAPGQGPLGGLNAALHYAEAHGFDAVLTSGCDMPRLPLYAREVMEGHEPVVLLGSRLVGLWPAGLAAMLDAYLAATGDRSIKGWMRAARAREAPIAARIANVNSIIDLVALAKTSKT